MFKKKNKHSEWFQGVLQGEELYGQGYREILAHERSLTVLKAHNENMRFFVEIHGLDRVQGIHDYYAHVLNNPEIFQKDSQEY